MACRTFLCTTAVPYVLGCLYGLRLDMRALVPLPAGGKARGKLVKEFVEKCFEPGGSFQENKETI